MQSLMHSAHASEGLTNHQPAAGATRLTDAEQKSLLCFSHALSAGEGLDGTTSIPRGHLCPLTLLLPCCCSQQASEDIQPCRSCTASWLGGPVSGLVPGHQEG